MSGATILRCPCLVQAKAQAQERLQQAEAELADVEQQLAQLGAKRSGLLQQVQGKQAELEDLQRQQQASINKCGGVL
jgi:septal ring factor EnvC (AmiA/AmiB activator)